MTADLVKVIAGAGVVLFGGGAAWIAHLCHRRRWNWVPLGAGVALAGAFFAAELGLGATRVVVVSVHDGRIAATDHFEFGAPHWPLARVRIVNETDHALTIEKLTYAIDQPIVGTASDLRTIDARAAVELDYDLDYIGPDDTPPNEIEVKEGTSATRYWLRW